MRKLFKYTKGNRKRMRGDFLKGKAIFMMFVIIVSIFTISNFDQVSADEATNACCEFTQTGDACIYTDINNCDNSFLVAQTSCEQTSFCEPGACISDLGQCSEGVSKAVCEDLPDYTWHPGVTSEYEACQKGCCVVAEGAQASFTTEKYCNYLIKDLEDISLDWRSDVTTESECSAIATNSNKGCCVTQDSCTYGTKAECVDSAVDLTTGDGFYDQYCSELAACPECIPDDHNRCVDEDVYSFDSCGNQEERVEDCSYIDGNWCGYDEVEDDYICKDISCNLGTFDGVYSIDGNEEERNVHDEKIGETREHGESWCLYESPAGGWFDRPGSQHYRAYCYFGEEIIEPCTDFREQVCLQAPYTDYYDYNILADDIERTGPILHEDYNIQTNEAGSRCLDNGFYQNLINSNVTSVPKGGNFWDGEESELVEQCSVGNQECPVTFTRKNHVSKWKCTYNCHCLTQDWVDETASFCALQGDCGASANIVNQQVDILDDSFYVTRSHESAGKEKKDGQIVNKTYVGYDSGCEAYFNGQGEDDSGCVEYCSNVGEDTEPLCYFISEPSFGQTEFLNSHYGIHGGMVGLSQSLDEIIQEEYSTLSGIATAGIVAGVAVGTLLVSSLVVTSVIGIAAGTTAGFGAVFGAVTTSAVNALTLTAAAAAPVPVIGWVVAGVVLIAAAITYLLVGGGDSLEVTVASSCQVWQPPQGGDYCSLCDEPVSEGGLALDNDGNILKGYECTEYKCRSLGQSCEYITENQGTDRPKCIQVEANDVNHPIIENAFLVGNYKDLQIDFGYDDYLRVETAIEPYTFFEFEIELDEPGQCKIDLDVKDTFEEMETFFPDSYYDTSHNQSWILTPDEEFSFNVRCQDHNGNYNIDAFVVQVTTLPGADITTPVIEATSIFNGAFVPANATETPLSIFIDEPVLNCKWSSNNVEYDLMENAFTCTGPPTNPTPLFDNSCDTALPINTNSSNNYYFACEDVAGNKNEENYEFGLVPTEPLNIDLVSPEGTLYVNDVELFVQTSVGAEEGKAICSYDGIDFFNKDSNVNTQILEDLPRGEYTYEIECRDIAGNKANDQISFTIDVDEQGPELTEIYLIDSILYYTMSEDTTCQSSYEDFVYGDGTDVYGSFSLTELATYYLTCQDTFGNEASYVINV
jgi:hypothetical protein